ncbi:unnamed protein product [Peronospora belbahrii]|uniref:Mitochondrial splicing suppressor 51-like C-terminal domain-containing protein n=1 Tax=Peronospora belbahrii TaxID=622444 RepID=A0AAU9L0S1_9STRA|nr:unnamed protein product [Peronospora belbahrii]CAH0518995.1 unnamed protein product [Peronospora belbahrii]
MFKHMLLLHRPSLLVGTVRSLSACDLRLRGIQSLVDALVRSPCLECGLQTSESRSQLADIENILAQHNNNRRRTWLLLSCSPACGDKIKKTQSEILAIYESMIDDIEYATTSDASILFSKVIHSSQRDSKEWEEKTPLTSWMDYFKLYRPTQRWLEDQRALRLLSSAYSYVMTLNRYLPELIEMDNTDSRPKLIELHVIGARAEAMMPRYLWKELSCFNPGWQFKIKLVGDHVPIMSVRKKTHTTMEKTNEKIRLEMINGLYHKIEPSMLGTPDAFVLYNPGIGHPRLRKNWDLTIQALLVSCKPLLITSFSLEDQQRDIAALHDIVASSTMLKQHELRFRCRPKLNSFRSLKYQVDPSNVGVPILTNNRVMVVQLVSGTEEMSSIS